MLRRSAAPLPLALLSVLLLSLAMAAPAMAKEGMQARLDAPIPADTPPGTTIEVSWTTFQTDEAGGRIIAFSGAPVFIALRSPGAAAPESVVVGDEFPSGSGHFTATIMVPEGGIAPDGVTIGLRGESCENGACARSDLAFELVGEVLTTAAVAPMASIAPVASAGVVASSMPDLAASPTTASTDSAPWLALAVVGGLLALGAVVVGIRAGRRRAASVALAPD